MVGLHRDTIAVDRLSVNRYDMSIHRHHLRCVAIKHIFCYIANYDISPWLPVLSGYPQVFPLCFSQRI